jgi:hypothetical protein
MDGGVLLGRSLAQSRLALERRDIISDYPRDSEVIRGGSGDSRPISVLTPERRGDLRLIC